MGSQYPEPRNLNYMFANEHDELVSSGPNSVLNNLYDFIVRNCLQLHSFTAIVDVNFVCYNKNQLLF